MEQMSGRKSIGKLELKGAKNRKWRAQMFW